MKPKNAWQDLDDWAMAQPRKAERRYAATAKTMTIPFVQAQSIYGPADARRLYATDDRGAT